ncbi:MAG: site-2 protease family protein [Nanoarchaeota archaeon]|nr:site-2 protease family protein [Nanoarchaeota archaeon]
MGLFTSFIFYDLIMLALFTIFIIWFLYTRRQKVEREGILYLYKTKVGLTAIDYIAKKGEKILRPMGYLVVALGYLLMVTVVGYLVVSVYQYFKYADLMTELMGNAPPIALFVPYFPRIFGYQDVFPEFWFVYFFIVIGIIAIVHEGAHGVYARLHNIKIKSTGFGFLGPILAFFVEQDEKDMKNKKIFPQLSVLGAGVFANTITALIFLGGLILFFNVAYIPIGVNIAGYSSESIAISDIETIAVSDEVILVNGVNLTKVFINDKGYFAGERFLSLSDGELSKYSSVTLYQDSPAIRAGIKGTIIQIEGNEIKSLEKLSSEIEKKEIGDKIKVSTLINGEEFEYEIELMEYKDSGRAIMGIGLGDKSSLQIFGLFEKMFKDKAVEYAPKKCSGTSEFFYYLFLWIIFANVILAFLNMLPVGIFDGGQFFYLSVLAVTRSEKIAKKCFKTSTMILLLLILLMMARWLVALW